MIFLTIIWNSSAGRKKGYWRRKETGLIVDAKALIFSLRCMDTAYQNFFKHQSGFPRFKAKYDRNQSYQTYQDVLS